MKTTFINTSKEKRTELRKTGRQHLEMRSDDFIFWMKHGTSKDDFNSSDDETYLPTGRQVSEEFENRGDFYDYGL